MRQWRQGSLACCSPWVTKSRTWLSDWTTRTIYSWWPFVENNVLSQQIFLASLSKNRSAIFLWVSSWTVRSAPLIYVSALTMLALFAAFRQVLRTGGMCPENLLFFFKVIFNSYSSVVKPRPGSSSLDRGWHRYLVIHGDRFFSGIQIFSFWANAFHWPHQQLRLLCYPFSSLLLGTQRQQSTGSVLR